MRLMKILIILFLSAKSLCKALPVASEPLENDGDQLLWQAAWFPDNARPESPFKSDSKKITAKSIFITPNIHSNISPQQYCPPGYLFDGGKCIKTISIQKTSEESLVTRLGNLLMSDDTNSFDYDYDSTEIDEDQDQSNDNFRLPLVPILNENNDGDGDDDDDDTKKVINTTEMPTTSSPDHTFLDFHTENKTDSVEIIISTLSNDFNVEWINSNDTNTNNNTTMTYDHHDDDDVIITSVNEFNETLMKNNDNDDDNIEIVSSSISSTLLTSSSYASPSLTTSTFEYENVTEETANSNENETTITISSVMQDRSNEDNQNIEPLTMIESYENDFSIGERNDSSSEVNSTTQQGLYEQTFQTEEAIIESSDTIKFDDAENAFLLNDSLLIVSDNMNATDYDDVTTLEPSSDVLFTREREIVESTTGNLPDAGIIMLNLSSISPLTIKTADVVPLTSTTTSAIDFSSQQDTNQDENHEKDERYSDDNRQNLFSREHQHEYETERNENVDTTNKFVYHHLSSGTIKDNRNKNNKLKFPEERTFSRVRFPDEIDNDHQTPKPLAPPTSFSWPRDPTTHIFQFWNQQPLIRDNQRGRENSKSFPFESFYPYTRKVQIVTPQRFNH